MIKRKFSLHFREPDKDKSGAAKITRTAAAQMEQDDDAVASASDESAMGDLLGELPEVDPATPEQPAADPNNRNPNDAAVEAAARKAEQDRLDREAKKSGKKTDEPAKVDDGKKADEPTDADKEADAKLEAAVEQAIADLPKAPENAPAHIKEALKAMKGALKKHLKIIQDKDAELELTKKERSDLKAVIEKAGDFDIEDYQNLKEFRRAKAIESDPEFIAKYDTPVKAQEEEAFGILKRLKIPDGVVEWINSNGGLSKFYYSDEPALGDDGKPLLDVKGNKLTQAEWFRQEVLDHPSLTEEMRDEVIDHVKSARKLLRERQKAVADAQKDAPGWEKKMKDRQTKAIEQEQEAINKAAAEEGNALGVYGVTIKPKDDATDEQKAAIKLHNERVERGVEIFKKLAFDPSPATRARAAVRAAHSAYLSDVNNDLVNKLVERDKTIKDLTDKLDRFKGAGRTSHLTQAPPASSQPRQKAPANEGDEDAMDRLMTEVTGSGAAK